MVFVIIFYFYLKYKFTKTKVLDACVMEHGQALIIRNNIFDNHNKWNIDNLEKAI